MITQTSLPGTQPLKAILPSKRRMTVALDFGAQAALTEAAAELRVLQKQHPAAVGVTLALAILDRRSAELNLRITRVVVATAASAGLPIEDHKLFSGIDGEEIVMTAEPDHSEGAPL